MVSPAAVDSPREVWWTVSRNNTLLLSSLLKLKLYRILNTGELVKLITVIVSYCNRNSVQQINQEDAVYNDRNQITNFLMEPQILVNMYGELTVQCRPFIARFIIANIS